MALETWEIAEWIVVTGRTLIGSIRCNDILAIDAQRFHVVRRNCHKSIFKDLLLKFPSFLKLKDVMIRRTYFKDRELLSQGLKMLAFKNGFVGVFESQDDGIMWQQ
jgi:hypothetical protein